MEVDAEDYARDIAASAPLPPPPPTELPPPSFSPFDGKPSPLAKPTTFAKAHGSASDLEKRLAGLGADAPIDGDSVFLRGCTLRSVDWMAGLVVNTGPDTKIMMSNQEPPSKESSLTLDPFKYSATISEVPSKTTST